MATTYPVGTGSGGVGTSVARLEIKSQVNGESEGTFFAANVSNANSPLYPQELSISAATFTAVSVPTKAGGVVIQPPASNTQTITLKGVTGDTGVLLSKTAPTTLTFDTTPPASIGILTGAGSAQTFKFYWF